MPPPDSLPEPRLNELLRQVDWRFLLRQRETPRVVDLRSGTDEALRLVARPAEGGNADLAVLGYPTRRGLRAARGALRPGGELVCLWRSPHPGGRRRERERLRRAGFGEIRLHRPGLRPGPPELWLPLDAPELTERLLRGRPPRSRSDAVVRRAWLLLGPTCAVARLAGGEEIDELLPAPEPLVLLTGGEESDAKVVGLSFAGGSSSPGAVAKFARLPKADTALEREAETLRRLERERPRLTGVPRVRASGRRAGQRAIVQDAVRGRSLTAMLDPACFATVAPAVTRWLLALAGEPAIQPASTWFERLVADPLDELERDFGDLLPTGMAARARRALADLDDLPLVCEHRDFGPWNIALEESGAPAAIDWEDAELQGLPGLDLTYFLASFAFAAEGALEGSEDGIEQVRESYGRLLEPGTELGAVATGCFEEYRAALDIDPSDLPRLRLLCWVVQALIAYRRRRDHGAAIASGEDFFIRLAEDELQGLEGPA